MASNSKFSEEEKAILLTILYSDIFDFALTIDELWRFLISEKKITRQVFLDTLPRLKRLVVSQDGYYCLRGREALIVERKGRGQYVSDKMILAKKAAWYLAHIPTIRFIGISGGLAIKNVDRDADIDFFIVTQKETLFMTRLWILFILEWLGLRRKRGEEHPADKICANLLIDEERLSWPAQQRDLYIAHEIAQIVPLFQRDNTYQSFVDKNHWVKHFLPNSQDEHAIFFQSPGKTDYWTLRVLSSFLFARPFEKFVAFLQKTFMKKHQTNEIIRKHILAFHPNDYRARSIEILRSKSRKLGLLTKF